MLREHIAQHGTGKDGRIFRTSTDVTYSSSAHSYVWQRQAAAPFPHAVPPIQVKGRRTDNRAGKTTIVTISVVTGVPPGCITHAPIAARARDDLAALDLIWTTDSGDAQLFRPGTVPPLRGTLLTLGLAENALYIGGGIEFYSTYPGMYGPHPIDIRPAQMTRSPRAGQVLLIVSKIDWNHARLDGRYPITLRTAEKVKRVLWFCDPGQAIATGDVQYM